MKSVHVPWYMQCAVHSTPTRRKYGPSFALSTHFDWRCVKCVRCGAAEHNTHTHPMNQLADRKFVAYLFGYFEMQRSKNGTHVCATQTSVRISIQIQSDAVMDERRAWPRALLTSHITPYVIVLCTFYTSTIDIACIRNVHIYHIHWTVHSAVFQPKRTSGWLV